MISPEDTIAAIATPLGEGGLGVIRVSGTKAISVVKHIFRPLKKINLETILSHTCYVGSVTNESPSPDLPSPSPLSMEKGSGDEGAIDQVVVTVFRAPHSYTGEDVVEISAHGNPFTLQKILALCLERGARLAGPGEFTERAFLNGKMDLTQAEAVSDLIGAKTDKAQAAALAQMQGSLAQKVRSLRDQLLPVLAHVEVGLDHSDEEHDFLSREHLIARCREVQAQVEALLQSTRVSKILREGFRVAFLGKPNVGKSSLLNALLKEDRAIVTPIPGTTRDTLEESINLNGIPVILTDTAGLRQGAEDPVERLGMGRTRKALEQTDLVLAIFDGSEPLTSEDYEVMDTSLTKPHVWVMNKCDLAARWENVPSSALRAPSPSGRGPTGVAVAELELPLTSTAVRVSAKTGEGLDTLIQTITHLALGEKAQVSEALWLLNARHHAALERAREALAQATQAAQSKAFEECVALELQTALGALGEIIGETTTEDLLDQIFSKFCIGK